MKTILQLNPNTEHVVKIRAAIKDNDGYCPCVFERTLHTKCPCRKMREEKECCCGLYVEKV